MDKQWGEREGLCAWCVTKPATSHYVGVMSNGEVVEYQVCAKHYAEFADYSKVA